MDNVHDSPDQTSPNQRRKAQREEEAQSAVTALAEVPRDMDASRR
jgi:hypothetical protein